MMFKVLYLVSYLATLPQILYYPQTLTKCYRLGTKYINYDAAMAFQTQIPYVQIKNLYSKKNETTNHKIRSIKYKNKVIYL